MADTLTAAWQGTVQDLFKAIDDWLPDGYYFQVDTSPNASTARDDLRLVLSYPGANLSTSITISREAMYIFAGDPKAIIWEAVRKMKSGLDLYANVIPSASSTPPPAYAGTLGRRWSSAWDAPGKWRQPAEEIARAEKKEQQPEPPPSRKIRGKEIA